MTRKALWFAGALVAVLGAGVWLAGREATLLWAVERAAALTNGRLTTAGVSGSLLGAIRFARIEWHDDGVAAVAENGALEFSPLPLLWRKIDIDRLQAEAVRITLADAGDAPAQIPESLRMPLRLSVDDATVANLQINHPDFSERLTKVSFDLAAGSQEWRAVIKAAQTRFGHLTGFGQIATASPFAVSGSVEVRNIAEPVYLAKVQASGTLARIEVNGSAEVQASSAKAPVAATSPTTTMPAPTTAAAPITGTVSTIAKAPTTVAAPTTATVLATFAPFAPQPIEKVHAQARGINPRAWSAAAPVAAFDIDLDVSGSRSTENLAGTLRVGNSAAGTLDRERLPLRSFTANLTGIPSAWDLNQVAVDLGEAGQLTGTGVANVYAVALALTTANLNMRGMHGKLRATRLAGDVALAGSAAAQRAVLALAQTRYRFALDATASDGMLRIAHAEARAGTSRLLASGHVGFSGRQPFALKGKSVRFDPAQFGDYPKADINSRFTASGELGPVLDVEADLTLDPSTLYGYPSSGHVTWHSRGTEAPEVALEGWAKAGETRVAARGTLVDPMRLTALDLRLELSGRDLADLYPVFGVPLPPTPQYRLAGRLTQRDRLWEFRKFDGQIGRSDLTGDFSLDRNKEPQLMRADLTSRRLDMRDLAGFVGAQTTGPKGASGNGPERVLPSGAFRLDKLNAADADIRFTGRRIVNETLPLREMSTRLHLVRGELSLDPLRFRAAGGSIDGNVVMNARGPVIRSAVDMRFTGLHLNRLFPALKSLSGSVGILDGRARLTGGGNTIAAMLGAAGGQAAFLMNGGEMSDLTLRLANLDLANALPALLTGDRKVPIRCLVADFSAQQGRLNVSTLVLDAAHTTLQGEGSIDLRDERLDLRIVAHPKEWSLFALRGPILVTGTLADPTVTPDVAGIALRTGVAVGLGVVATPLAALIPFIAPGQRPQTDCSSLIADVRGFTAPPDAASSIKGTHAGS
ncbi:MAG: AsmA family protein [Casimicrobiaceae bacterium]